MSNFSKWIESQDYSQINSENYDYVADSDLFERMVEFITSLEPDELSDDQLEEVLDILDDLEIKGQIYDYEDDFEEIDEVRKRVKRTKQPDRMSARRYYKRNRAKIKKRKKRFQKSAKGRLRKAKAKRLAKTGRTPTGRKKTSYHR
jgi:ATPase subunit of ABC transporter with duplicated ATPase domains